MGLGCRRVRVLTDADVRFGLIPHEHWYQPDWIDEERATAARNEMVKHDVHYGGTCVFRLAAHPLRDLSGCTHHLRSMSSLCHSLTSRRVPEIVAYDL